MASLQPVSSLSEIWEDKVDCSSLWLGSLSSGEHRCQAGAASCAVEPHIYIYATSLRIAHGFVCLTGGCKLGGHIDLDNAGSATGDKLLFF